MNAAVAMESMGFLMPFGVLRPLPLAGWPDGKIRIRIRNKRFVEGFVSTGSAVRHFMVCECAGYWWPCYEQGRNMTVPR